MEIRKIMVKSFSRIVAMSVAAIAGYGIKNIIVGMSTPWWLVLITALAIMITISNLYAGFKQEKKKCGFLKSLCE